MIDEGLVQKIRQEKKGLLIGVIGATIPSLDYNPSVSRDVGYALRNYVAEKEGRVFTGGVGGVGVDVYQGVINACLDQESLRELSGEKSNDHFFVLIPQYVEIISKEEVFVIQYSPPSEYSKLAKQYSENSLNIVVAGYDMEERRTYLSQVADALIVINGGGGTFDEAKKLVDSNKPVIPYLHSGGAASMLGAVKTGVYSREVIKLMKKLRIAMWELEDLEKNKALIHPVTNTSQMLRCLDDIFLTRK